MAVLAGGPGPRFGYNLTIAARLAASNNGGLMSAIAAETSRSYDAPIMSERLEKLLKLHAADPEDPFCPYGIAMEHAKAGDHQKALDWLDKTLHIDATYPYAYYQKAKLLGEAGQKDAARSVVAAGIIAARQVGDDHARSELEELGLSLE